MLTPGSRRKTHLSGLKTFVTNGPLTTEADFAGVVGKIDPENRQGFSERVLACMIRFAKVISNQEVMTGMSRQLGWSQFVEIIPLNCP